MSLTIVTSIEPYGPKVGDIIRATSKTFESTYHYHLFTSNKDTVNLKTGIICDWSKVKGQYTYEYYGRFKDV